MLASLNNLPMVIGVSMVIQLRRMIFNDLSQSVSTATLLIAFFILVACPALPSGISLSFEVKKIAGTFWDCFNNPKKHSESASLLDSLIAHSLTNDKIFICPCCCKKPKCQNAHHAFLVWEHASDGPSIKMHSFFLFAN